MRWDGCREGAWRNGRPKEEYHHVIARRRCRTRSSRVTGERLQQPTVEPGHEVQRQHCGESYTIRTRGIGKRTTFAEASMVPFGPIENFVAHALCKR